MRRTERLFAITEYLRARRTGVTAEILAERFGVTMRTMYRDLASLREANLPLGAERGRGGGYALERTYSLPPVNFTAREAALLVATCRNAITMRTLPFVETLGTALDKVQGALSTSSQRELMQHIETLHFIGVPARAAKPEVRKVIERAWFERQPVEIGWWPRDDAQVQLRRVEIRSVVMERTETLLNCHDLDKGESRQFRFDRIVSARPIA
jgi:predicted DNA-binding transcriptional regulator YafY